MNNQMMAGMNPGMNGMNLGMGMNPGMNGMNLGMGMNQGMPGMGMNGMNMYGMGMNGMNPGMLGMGMAGMNQGMGMMNPMVMGGGFNPGMGMNPMMGQGINMSQLTPQQKRYLGYMMGKEMALKKKKTLGQSTETSSDNVSAPISPETEITIKFKKGGSSKEIKMKAGAMIAELLGEYYEKTQNQGPFKYKGNTLNPEDCTSLLDNGMKDGDEIIVG